MRRQRKTISDSEKAHRARQRAQALDAVDQLLYTRRQTAKVLAVSIATVLRLENRGLIDKVRLAGANNGKGIVYHRAQQVLDYVEAAARADIIALTDGGLQVHELAERLNLTADVVSRILRAEQQGKERGERNRADLRAAVARSHAPGVRTP